MAINPKTNNRIINPVVSSGTSRESLLNKIKLKIQEKVSSNKQNSVYGNFGDFSGLDRSIVNTSNTRDLLNTIPNTDLMGKPYDPATDRYSEIPEEYRSKITGGTLSPLARFSNIPESMGYGQYVNDPSQPNTLLKSTREQDITKTRWDNAMLLGGLPNDTFQVEHIIPLWAGGSDTMNNKTIMSKVDHEQKTKAQAVAMTLLYAGKINKSSALAMSMNWKDKNVDGIELDNNNGGIIKGDSLKIAEDKVVEWNTPKGATFRDWVNETPETLRKIESFGEDVATKIMPASTYDFMKSVASGLTFGWYKPSETDYSKWAQPWNTNQQDPRSEVEKAAKPVMDFIGNTAGTIVSFASLAGAVAKVSGLFRASPIASKLGLANKLSPAEKISQTLATKLPKISGGKINISGDKIARAIDSMGLFTLHGQVSRGDNLLTAGIDAALGREQEISIPDMGGKILTDMSMGALFGTAGHNWKSVNPLKNDYTRVGIGTFSLSYLEGAGMKDSIVNSATMMAMHGLGFKGNKQAMAMNAKNINQKATEFAIETRRKLLNPSEDISLKPPVDTKAPTTETKPTYEGKFTAERIETENYQIRQRLIEDVKADKISPGEAQRKNVEAIVSGKQLYAGSLGREARLSEEFAALRSIAKRAKENKNDLIEERPGIPRTLVNYVNKNWDPSLTPRDTGAKPIDISEYKGDMPVGKIQVTGVANSVSPETANNIRNLAPLWNSGKVDGSVFFVYRPDYKGLVKGVNKTITKKDIEAGTHKKYENPEKNVEIFKIVDGVPVSYGMVARPWKINDAKYSQNNSINEANAKYGTKHPLLDANLNKNTISEAAVRNNTEVIEGRILDIRPEALGSGQPVMIVELTKEGWLNSVAKSRGLKPLDQINSERIQASWKEARQMESPSKQLRDLPMPEEGSAIIKSAQKEISPMITEFQNAKTPADFVAVVNKYFGKGVTTESKMAELLKDGKRPTYKEIQETFDTRKITESGELDAIYGLNSFDDVYKNYWDAIVDTPLVTQVNPVKAEVKKPVVKKEVAKPTPVKVEVKPVVKKETVKPVPVKPTVQEKKSSPIQTKIPTQQSVVAAMKKVVEPTTSKTTPAVEDYMTKIKNRKALRSGEVVTRKMTPEEIASTKETSKTFTRVPDEEPVKKTLTRDEINQEISRRDFQEERIDTLEKEAKILESKSEAVMDKTASKLVTKSLTEKLSVKEQGDLDRIASHFENKYNNVYSPIIINENGVRRAVSREEAKGLVEKLKSENKPGNKKTIDSINDKLYGEIGGGEIRYNPIFTSQNLSLKGVKNPREYAFWSKYKKDMGLDLRPKAGTGILDRIIESKKNPSEPLNATKQSKILSESKYEITDKEMELMDLVQMGKFSKLPKDIIEKVKLLQENNPGVRLYAAPGSYKDINNALNNKKVGSFNLYPYIRESVKAPEVFDVLSKNGIKKNKLSDSELSEVNEFLRSGDKSYLKSKKIKSVLLDYFESKKDIGSGMNVSNHDGSGKDVSLNKEETLSYIDGLSIKTKNELRENERSLLDIYHHPLEQPGAGIKEAERAASNLASAVKAINSIMSKYKNK